MQTEEAWKDIPGYNGRYQASNLGRIRSMDREVTKSNGSKEFYKGKVLKPFVGTNGYLYITIAEEPGKFRPRRLHRVIAETFIPNPLNLPQINHINEDKTDNRVCNLEWCTAEYNTFYGHRIEKFAKSNRNNPALSKGVNQYDLEGNYLRNFPSAAEASRYLGRDCVAACRIGQCCRHLFKTGNSAYGYLWEFSSEDNIGRPIEKLQTKGFPVYQYSIDRQFIKRWDTVKEAVEVLNLNYSSICRAYTHGTICGGFRWSKTLLQI